MFEAVKARSDSSLPRAHTASPPVDIPEIDTAGALLLADLQDRVDAFEMLIGQCYKAELGLGATAVDGGAHYGTHTGPMARLVGPRGRVHAFEPLPFAAAELRRMFAAHPQVSVHQKALAEREGTGSFNCIVNDPARSSLLKRDLGSAPLQSREIEVETTTLDQLAAAPVRFIKLDVEGYD